MSPIVAKIISLLIITLGSSIFGFLPALLGIGRRYQQSVLLSAILCFGGGVLFAISVIHILPDVSNGLPKWSELIFCLGFLLIYLVDSCVSYFNDGHHHHFHHIASNEGRSNTQRNYGSVDVGTEPSVSFSPPQDTNQIHSKFMNIGLLLAFIVHALLEGLVVGIQDTDYEVWLLLGAICSHKFLVAFCLGSELVSDGSHWRKLIFPIGLFVFSSDLGLCVGMFVEVDGVISMHTSALLEGLAGGSLLYIALCEILPREKARELPSYAALVQFAAVLVGFSLMTAITLLI